MNPEAPSIKAIVLRHKAATAAAVAVVLVLVGMTAALPSAKAGAHAF